MRVEFHKTGERRYGVVILRRDLPDLAMNPVPGFDPLMPHDLLHFLVEQELGLRKGIFGQIALGGTAGTFHEVTSAESDARGAERRRRKTAKRGKNLLQENLDDCARSERATYICLYEWLQRSSDAQLRARAAEMKPGVESTKGQMTAAERDALDAKLPKIRARMDELSRRWSLLQTNEFISLEW